MKKKYKIKKKDSIRPLLTEVLPFETPLFFSNSGFYLLINKILKEHDQNGIDFFKELGFENITNILEENYDFSVQEKERTPFVYSIQKDGNSKRFLAIPHPFSQLNICHFYRHFSNFMVYFCSKSPLSLRHPYKIATSYYDFSGAKDFSRFKTESQVQDENEDIQKYAASYFAYKPYTRLFHYINSEVFFEAEQQFSFLRKLDISNCFDSIYTHSIVWATKNKELAKRYRREFSFGNQFDTLMRNLNCGETLGIIIGPEVSRIFAEIILQAIDLRTVKLLGEKHLKLNCDYSIKRYVDDYFIFTHSEEDSILIKSILTEECKTFKMNLNTQKELFLHTPFVTENTCGIEKSRIVLKSFYSSFLKKNREHLTIVPRKIWSVDNLVRSFGNKVKVISRENCLGLSKFSSFLLGSLSQKVIVLTRNRKIEPGEIENYENALSVLLGAIFYIYGLSPSVNSSYNVALSIALALRFLRKEQQTKKDSRTGGPTKLIYTVFSSIKKFLENQLRCPRPSASLDAHLEILNLLIALKEVKPSFILPNELLKEIFMKHRKENTKNYFLITSFLFYIGEDAHYTDLKLFLENEINTSFETEITNKLLSCDCETFLYVLDMLSCPFLPEEKRINWCKKVFNTTNNNSRFEYISQNYWFTNWRESDLLNLLEKKRKQIVY